MRCPRCQADAPASATFCPSCGSSLGPSASTPSGHRQADADATVLSGGREAPDVTRLEPGGPASSSAPPGVDATRRMPAPDASGAGETILSPSSAGGGGPAPPVPGRPPAASASSTPEEALHFSTSGSFAAGRLLGSRYRIDRLLGAGGMGAVYKAQDLELDIPVAVKVIRPEILGDTRGGREFSQRFKQELLLARQVTHRNVLRIHDLGEAEGTRYITMPFIEGRDLAHVLQDGPMPLERVLPLARQLASGLAAAHDAGVVHRDLKPHNILIDTSNTAYISDFGLAKSLESSTAGVTKPGEFLGTPRYVAPEQVEGQPVDSRTDIYALGLILYEMVTGDVPFTGTSLIELLMKRVRELPRNLKDAKPDVPDFFSRIVMRCLEKDPAARYQSAHEIVADLDANRATAPAASVAGRTMTLSVPRAGRRPLLAAGGLLVVALAVTLGLWFRGMPWSSSAPGGSRATAVPPLSAGRFLAVMPFRVLGDPAGVDYVAEGLSEALSARLFQLQGVQVTPAASVREAGVKDTVEKTARALGVNLIVEGIVQAAGDQIRVIVNLQDVPGARRVWSQQFTGVTKDLFALEDQIYSQLVQVLDVSPNPADAVRAASLRTHDVESYDLYLRGRKALRGQDDVKNIQSAVQLFEQALKEDPSFALAQAGLADASLGMYRETKDSFWSQRALAAATRASDLKEDLPEVQLSLGSVYLATGRHTEALVALQKALELAPNSDEALRRLGNAYLETGRHKEALDSFSKAIEVNPYFWYNHNMLGEAYLDIGQYDQGLEAFRKVTELEPDSPVGYENMGSAYFKQGKWEECIPAYEKALSIQPYYLTYSNLGTAFFFLQRYDDAVKTFEKAVELHPSDAITVGNLADALRWSSQKDRAKPTYEKAIALAYQELQVNPREATTLGMVALYYAKIGDNKNAAEFIGRARAVDPNDLGLSYAEAVVNMLAGRKAQALASLERAFKGGYSPREAESDPELTELAASPEFKRLARQYGAGSE